MNEWFFETPRKALDLLTGSAVELVGMREIELDDRSEWAYILKDGCPQGVHGDCRWESEVQE